MGKQFKDAAAAAQPVYNTLIGSAQDTQQEQEAYNAQDTPSTQGRKGAKLPRINMAFSPQNLEYLRVMSGIRGISITKYVNTLIEQDREKNAETYEAAKRLTSDRTVQDI